MAIYTDTQLAQRVNSVLYANTGKEIDATELRDLLLDFVDSKMNTNSGIGAAVPITIEADDLVGNGMTIEHGLNTNFPVVFIKSNIPDGTMWGSIHFSYGASSENYIWIHFEEDLPAGSSIEGVVVKFN